MGSEPDLDYQCTWARHGVAAVVTSCGHMRGQAAFDLYLDVVNSALENPEISAIVSDVRRATRLPSVSDCIRFSKAASTNPKGHRVRRSAAVTADTHPVMSVLLRIIASGSRFFPERRVFTNDLEAAIAWANQVAPSEPPGRDNRT